MYSLENYKLTLPVDDNGNLSGNAHEILQPDLLTYSSEWFEQVEDGYLFRCPDGGATTSGSSSARCELRDSRDFGYDENAAMPLNMSVIKQDIHNKNLILAQIHAGFSPIFKLVHTNKNGVADIRLFIKDGSIENGDLIEEKITILDKVPLQTALNGFVMYRAADNGEPAKLICGINGQVVVRTMYHQSGEFFFKKGAYYGNNTLNGDIAEVLHF